MNQLEFYKDLRLISLNSRIKYLPNNPQIHLRACDDASEYQCTSLIKVSKIPKRDCILKCCSYCPGTNATDVESS